MNIYDIKVQDASRLICGHYNVIFAYFCMEPSCTLEHRSCKACYILLECWTNHANYIIFRQGSICRPPCESARSMIFGLKRKRREAEILWPYDILQSYDSDSKFFNMWIWDTGARPISTAKRAASAAETSWRSLNLSKAKWQNTFKTI